VVGVKSFNILFTKKAPGKYKDIFTGKVVVGVKHY